MTNIVVLNKETHRNLHVLTETSGKLGDNQRFVQVVAAEFSQLVVQCPILLSKDADTGAFYCGAMLGFDEDENLFLREGKRYEGYRPLNLQRMPFYVAGSDLGIDLDHARVSEEKGTALFNADGSASTYLQSIMSAFQQLKPGLEVTKVFVETLLTLKLVEPIDIQAGFDDGETRELGGLYTINQAALRNLTDEKVIEMFRRGYLQLIYLMIASLKQVTVLAQKKNDRLLE